MGYNKLSQKLKNHPVGQEFSSADRVEIYNAKDSETKAFRINAMKITQWVSLAIQFLYTS